MKERRQERHVPMISNRNRTSRRREDAVDWWIRGRAGPLSHEEQAAFAAWRADPANAAAFANVERLCDAMAGLPLAPKRRPTPGRLRLAVAASVATLLLLAVLDGGGLWTLLRADHSAGADGTKLVALADGSRAHLNARSAIALHYDAKERRLALLEGEAFVEVSPEARPFVVEAAGADITALGTAFDVSLEGSGARVTVTKHSVRISSGGRDVVVGEDQQSVFRLSEAPRAPTAVKADWVTAWRRDKLIVENAPLREVLAALGRRRHGLLVCMSAAICSRGVTGVFPTDDVEQALDALEVALGMRMTRITRFLVLAHE
jgi:transmembrane sensor